MCIYFKLGTLFELCKLIALQPKLSKDVNQFNVTLIVLLYHVMVRNRGMCYCRIPAKVFCGFP